MQNSSGIILILLIMIFGILTGFVSANIWIGILCAVILISTLELRFNFGLYELCGLSILTDIISLSFIGVSFAGFVIMRIVSSRIRVFIKDVPIYILPYYASLVIALYQVSVIMVSLMLKGQVSLHHHVDQFLWSIGSVVAYYTYVYLRQWKSHVQ